MQYVENVGITVTKPELAALVQFCGESDRLANVSIRIGDGKLVAWATDGGNAAYLHGKSWDGKGKSSSVEREWQIDSGLAKTIAKSMGKDTEAILHTSKKLALVEAEIKAIDDGKSLMKIELDGHVSEQLDLKLPDFFPTRPPRDTGEVPRENVYFAWGSLDLLKRVCKSAGTGAIRVFVNSNPSHPIYCEVATPQQMQDDYQPEWICVLMPSTAVEREALGDAEDDDAED